MVRLIFIGWVVRLLSRKLFSDNLREKYRIFYLVLFCLLLGSSVGIFWLYCFCQRSTNGISPNIDDNSENKRDSDLFEQTIIILGLRFFK